MSRSMSREQRNRLLTMQRTAEAVIAVVNDTPEGAPADRLYLPLSEYLSRDEFEMMMRALTAAERISRRGDCYFPAASRNRPRRAVSNARDRRCNALSTSARLSNKEEDNV
jgi:hypothetical protein